MRGQVFCTGRVGEWLFTGAYNSQHSLNKVVITILGYFAIPSQTCEDLYPVYGDGSKGVMSLPPLR